MKYIPHFTSTKQWKVAIAISLASYAVISADKCLVYSKKLCTLLSERNVALALE